MPTSYTLRVRGQRTGEIRGDGPDGAIVVHAWNHEMTSPRDAASGLPTGRRQHRPLTVIKAVDRSSPLLMNVFVNNENLTEVTLEVSRDDDQGQAAVYWRVHLVNASIAVLRDEGLNTLYPDNERFLPRESVSFTYQRIEWTYVDGGVMAVDDWEVPV